MKNYSLVKIDNDPHKQEPVSWTAFEEKMREHEVNEAIIFAVGQELTPVNLCKRMLINKAIVKPDNIGCWDDYCLIDHENADKIVPCLVLLDADIEYAVIKTIEFQPNDFFIQCRVIKSDNSFVVNKCELDIHNNTMEQQEEYNQWVSTTNVSNQDNLCGGNQISKNEEYFIKKYAKTSILDIGCGTGHRTFPEWKRMNINFYGLEKFQNLIDASIYKEKIILSDIGNESFKQTVQEIFVQLNSNKKIDISFLFGGVINGIIDTEKQEKTWDNLSFLSEKCDFILVDTLTHFPWYETQDLGLVEELFHLVPPQYFYSKKEIERLNEIYDLEICEEKSEYIGHLKRTHYLLRKRKAQ